MTDCYLVAGWLLWRIKAVRNQAPSLHALDIAMVDLLPEDHEDETEDRPPVWIAVWITCGLMLWAAIGFAARVLF